MHRSIRALYEAQTTQWIHYPDNPGPVCYFCDKPAKFRVELSAWHIGWKFSAFCSLYCKTALRCSMRVLSNERTRRLSLLLFTKISEQ